MPLFPQEKEYKHKEKDEKDVHSNTINCQIITQFIV